MKRELAYHSLLCFGLVILDVVWVVIGFQYAKLLVMLSLLTLWVYRGHMFHVSPLYILAISGHTLGLLFQGDEGVEDMQEFILQDFKEDGAVRSEEESIKVLGMINYVVLNEVIISLCLIVIFVVGQKI